MGYYSDVVLTLSCKGMKYFKDLIESSSCKNEVDQLLNDADKRIERDRCILYLWTSIKWYQTYPEISFIQNIITTQISQEEFYFIRIGETYSDIEEFGCFYDNPFSLCVVCELSFS